MGQNITSWIKFSKGEKILVSFVLFTENIWVDGTMLTIPMAFNPKNWLASFEKSLIFNIMLSPNHGSSKDL